MILCLLRLFTLTFPKRAHKIHHGNYRRIGGIMINTKESRAGAIACIEGMNELEKNMGNPLGDDLYEQHLKDVNNGIQLIIKAAVK